MCGECTLELKICVLGSFYTHASSSSSVYMDPKSACFIFKPQQTFDSTVSHSCHLSWRLSWLTLKLENPPAGRSRHAPLWFMSFELRHGYPVTESQPYMSQFESMVGKGRACHANGSLLPRNWVQAVLPAAVKNDSVLFTSQNYKWASWGQNTRWAK